MREIPFTHRPPNPDAALMAMLDEYRALYSLVLFRLSSLDRYVPAAGATLTGFIAATTALVPESRVLVLLAMPLGVVWLLRVTVNHARSFEDALRRIEIIELRVNELLASDTMAFQHRHPSRGRSVGGRTGHETIRSVWTAGLLMLGACVVLLTRTPGIRWEAVWCYLFLVVASLGAMLKTIYRWRRYTYRPGAILRGDPGGW